MWKIFSVIMVAVIVVVSGCSINQPAPKPVAQEVATGVTVDGILVEGLTARELESMLNVTAGEKYFAPVNAGFDENGNVTDDRMGRRFNITATVDQVMTAPPNSHLSAIYQDILPEITTALLKKAAKIGSYTSPILSDQPDRMHNVKLTAKLITNSIIGPGNEFSFNRTTGEPTAERGFKKATVFTDDGRHEEGIGGGMCQVSSTLYNAVLDAKLTVTERHPHSQPVHYVPVNRDATTYTDKDFRFVNSSRQPIVIRSFVSGKHLTVDLLSIQ